MAKILLVEDDPILAKSLFLYIRSENHDPVWEPLLQSAKSRIAKEHFDLIVLDVNLPDGDGISFCRSLRNGGYARPMIILTALTSEEAAIGSLTSGANDFIRKPCSVRELLSRMRVHLYGTQLSAESQVRQFAGVEIDLASCTLRYGATQMSLSRTKIEILDYLLANANRIVARDALLQHLRKESDVYDRTVDAHISQIRRLLKDKGIHHIQITSIYGAGYKIEDLQKTSTAR